MQTVTELPAFEKSAALFLSEDEIAAFVSYIAANPKAGDLMPRCNGLRKVRWARRGMGKSGGARVIYYWHDKDKPIFLVFAYAKAKRETLTREQEKVFSLLVDQIKQG